MQKSKFNSSIPQASYRACEIGNLVDSVWYSTRHPEIAVESDVLQHYLAVGRLQGWDPNPWFSTKWYVEQYPDWQAGGAPSPLHHFVTSGASAGAFPHPYFDLVWYSRRYFGSAPFAGALAHFLHKGIHEGAVPDARLDRIETEDRLLAEHPARRETLLQGLLKDLVAAGPMYAALVDQRWYFQRYPEAAAGGLTAAEHYRSIGSALGYDPNAWFCNWWYQIVHARELAGTTCALDHFVKCGSVLGLQPSPFFDVCWYSSQYLRLRSPHAEALRHFLDSGCRTGAAPERALHHREVFEAVARTGAENRQRAVLRYQSAARNDLRLMRDLVPARWYRNRYAADIADDEDAALHYHLRGWQCGFDPNPWFKTNWYLDQNPVLRKGHLSPLAHFVATGAAAGQSSHPDLDLREHARKFLGSGPTPRALEHVLILCGSFS